MAEPLEPQMPSEVDNRIAFARLFMRKDRPLPKRGCSTAFFIFLALLVAALIVYYIIYQNQ